MNDISKALLDFAKCLKNVSKLFAQIFENYHFKRPPFQIADSNWIYVKDKKLTNYKCSKCGYTLIIESHNKNNIIYYCNHCHKIHVSKKNCVIGRFNLKQVNDVR